jgi:acetyltransferase-like isoleucine patch superfamily enzyme
MKTDYQDYLLSGLFIGLALAVTVALLAWVDEPLFAALGPLYAPIALAVLCLALYGGVSALLLAGLDRLLPLKPGSYRVSHPQFRLWKLRHVATALAKAALTPFFPVFSRQALYGLLGVRVGRNVAVAGTLLDPTLTVLEDGSVVGEGAIVACHAMARGRFLLRPVRVGKGATVGGGALVMHGVTIGEGAVILPGALVQADTQIPAGEVWGGMPAVCVKPARRAGAGPEADAD